MKEFFKFLFKGSINNQELIENSKVHSFLSSIIVLVLSLIVAIVPTFVSIARQKGSAIMTDSNNQSLTTGLTLFSNYLDDNNIDIIIDNGKINIDSVKFDGETEYSVTVPDRNDSTKDEELFVVKVCKEEVADSYAKMYQEGRADLEEQVSDTPRSFVIISETNIRIGLFNPNTKNVLNTDSEGNPVAGADGKYTIKTIAQYSVQYAGTTEKLKNKVNLRTFSNATSEDGKYDASLTNWSELLNDLYKPYKNRNMWIATGLFSAINAGSVIIVALLIFILTHLKHSTGEKINYLEALKMTGFGSLAPAIVALALGFIISSFAQIGFVLCLGLRSTFLAMKASNPQNQA